MSVFEGLFVGRETALEALDGESAIQLVEHYQDALAAAYIKGHEDAIKKVNEVTNAFIELKDKVSDL